MALDAPPVPTMVGNPGRPGLARRYAGVAVCGGVLALVVTVGVHEARRPVAPRSASVLATEPITPGAPAPEPAPVTAVPVTAVPVTTVPVAAVPATMAPVTVAPSAAPAVPTPAPVVAGTAVTTATVAEPVFPLGALCWPLGAGARTAAGAPIMCTRLDPAGQAYPDGHARWRRT